jgi:hypothetical protein
MTKEFRFEPCPMVIGAWSFVILLPPPMSPETRRNWLPIAILAAALCFWAALFALGAYLEPSADEPRHDWRKPLIVLGCMAGFLVFWGIALWRRSRR